MSSDLGKALHFSNYPPRGKQCKIITSIFPNCNIFRQTMTLQLSLQVGHSDVSVQPVTQLCPTLYNPMTAAHQASLSITNSRSLSKLMSIELVILSNHFILCRPLLLLPPIPPSIRVFSNESTFHMRWPKYWSFSLSIIPSKEIPGLISFRMDWLDLLAIQGTLKSLLQHHSSKASVLQCSAFFMDQLSHPYMTTGKTIALTRWTFVGKVMSLLLNMLSRLVITFLPRSKRLLISWLHQVKQQAIHSGNNIVLQVIIEAQISCFILKYYFFFFAQGSCTEMSHSVS